MSKKTRKQKEERRLEQVASATLAEPTEPAEPTEADVDFKNEEANLDLQIRKLKAKKAELASRKRGALGSKKLDRMRKHAQAATDWANKAAGKFATSTGRANDAVRKLNEYETKLGITSAALAPTLAKDLELSTEAAEVIEAAKS